MHPKPLTWANTRKPALACSSDWSLVRAGSRCFATSRGLYAACRWPENVIIPLWKPVEMKRFVAIIVTGGLLAVCGEATTDMALPPKTSVTPTTNETQRRLCRDRHARPTADDSRPKSLRFRAF